MEKAWAEGQLNTAHQGAHSGTRGRRGERQPGKGKLQRPQPLCTPGSPRCPPRGEGGNRPVVPLTSVRPGSCPWAVRQGHGAGEVTRRKPPAPRGGVGTMQGVLPVPRSASDLPPAVPAPFPQTLVSKQHACQAALSQHVRFINYLLRSRNGTVSATTGHVCTSGRVCPAGLV